MPAKRKCSVAGRIASGSASAAAATSAKRAVSKRSRVVPSAAPLTTLEERAKMLRELPSGDAEKLLQGRYTSDRFSCEAGIIRELTAFLLCDARSPFSNATAESKIFYPLVDSIILPYWINVQDIVYQIYRFDNQCLMDRWRTDAPHVSLLCRMRLFNPFITGDNRMPGTRMFLGDWDLLSNYYTVNHAEIRIRTPLCFGGDNRTTLRVFADEKGAAKLGMDVDVKNSSHSRQMTLIQYASLLVDGKPYACLTVTPDAFEHMEEVASALQVYRADEAYLNNSHAAWAWAEIQARLERLCEQIMDPKNRVRYRQKDVFIASINAQVAEIREMYRGHAMIARKGTHMVDHD